MALLGLAQIGIPGLILIIGLALIIFGPKKLPEIGKAAGQTLREFKNSTNDLINENEQEESTEESENHAGKNDAHN